MAELQQSSLPPGWDCRFDKKSGKYYYINHQSKTTTWDDPRMNKHRTSIEYVPLQHGSPEFRRNYVYPSQTTPKHAFQAPARYSPKVVPLQDFNVNLKGSPKPAHVILQDSSMKTVVNTDEAVAKISAMFPTVSDTHIRLLLKKYMKSIFPKAEEVLILDLLTGNDNNIQKVSEALKEMGFERRDSTPKVKQVDSELPKDIDEPELKAVVIQVLKTLEQKKLAASQLQEKYKDVPEQVVTIALESAEYNEDRAHQILNIMIQEENSKTSSDDQQESPDDTTSQFTGSTSVPKSQSRQSLKSLLKTDKSDYSLKDSCSFSRVIEYEEMNGMDDNRYCSSNLTSTQGANRSIVKGANQDLLLEDYVKWQGPQPALTEGAKISLAKGPNRTLLTQRNYQACGPDSNLYKGPKLGLAKGSIFSQLKGIVNGTEVRGK